MKVIPDWAYWIAIALLLSVTGIQQVRIAGLGTDIAREQKARSDERAARTNAALEHTQAVSALQAQHAANQQDRENDHAAKLAKLENENRAGIATAVRLRGQLTAFTASGRRPGETDAALIQRYTDRLKIVGGLLEESVDLVTEGRGVVERRDAEVGRLMEQIQIDRAACSPKPTPSG